MLLFHLIILVFNSDEHYFYNQLINKLRTWRKHKASLACAQHAINSTQLPPPTTFVQAAISNIFFTNRKTSNTKIEQKQPESQPINSPEPTTVT